MSAPDGGNRYEYPNGVLRNLLGITDAEALNRVEATYAAIRAAELFEHPISGRFDFDHLCAIHRSIFQDIYEWAGEPRQVDIIKGSSRFAHFRFIESSAKTIFDTLAAEQYLRGLPGEEFAARAAYHLGELNALHPFREGNGRAQRMFLSALARSAGFDLAWERISAEEMTEASIRSLFAADNAGFERILRNIILPL